MTTKTPPSVRDSKGPIGLGKVLGKGGEGAVYEIAGRPDQVAKIYHPEKRAGKAPKIEAMIPLKSDRLLSLAAWPLDLVWTSAGEFMGLLIPRVHGHKDIHTLYSPRSRKVEFPNADWRFLVRAAANTARAFAAIHETGCVIGDVNHGGIRVSDKATVRLIDCDSFQVSAGGRKYLCEVGVPTFTPPELQGKPFRGVVRTANHDNFGLAVMVFHLLFMGRHPFAGRFLGRGDMSIEQAIGEFRFAYGASRASVQMEPPPNVPAIAIASQPLHFFHRRSLGACRATVAGLACVYRNDDASGYVLRGSWPPYDPAFMRPQPRHCHPARHCLGADRQAQPPSYADRRSHEKTRPCAGSRLRLDSGSPGAPHAACQQPSSGVPPIWRKLFLSIDENSIAQHRPLAYFCRMT